MKFSRTLFTSSLLAAGMIAASAQAATLPALRTNVLGGPSSSTSATFTGGATLNGGANYLKEIPAGVPVDVKGSIAVSPADVGQEGDLYVAVNVQGDFYSLTPDGPVTWDFDRRTAAGLTPYMTKTLAANESISVADFESKMGMSLDGKVVTVYMAYMSDSSNLNYASPVRMEYANVPSNSECPSGLGSSIVGTGSKRLCVLTGEYKRDLHLTNNFEYVLAGAVFIGGDNVDKRTITFDPGVKTYGESGSDFLVIRRGSKISVNGTADMPVIMTSANDSTATSSTRGQWGGLIINGNAPINGCTEGTAVCEAEGEGNTGLYGGNDAGDSSGNLNYLVVKYAGFEITPDNELNGIAFQAVGSGTLVDYVQVHNNSDDGVEFFGGTVNAKHLYLSGIGDDSVDWTKGWTGKLQHVVVVQTDRGDQGIEADNNDSNRDSLPRSMPVISNITLIGNTNTDYGMLLREGTGAKISNAVVTGFGDECINIDHPETFANAGISALSLTGNLTITNSVVHCPEDGNFEDDIADAFLVSAWFTNQSGNSEVDPGMSSYINSATVNALTPATQTDSFFDVTAYVGAVKDADSDWTAGWTYKD